MLRLCLPCIQVEREAKDVYHSSPKVCSGGSKVSWDPQEDAIEIGEDPHASLAKESEPCLFESRARGKRVVATEIVRICVKTAPNDSLGLAKRSFPRGELNPGLVRERHPS
jgi:hypothetical protein